MARNYQAATKYFRMAAERKHPGASSMLGYCYFKGRGLPTHNKLAMLWFRRAAEMGDAKAMMVNAHTHTHTHAPDRFLRLLEHLGARVCVCVPGAAGSGWWCRRGR